MKILISLLATLPLLLHAELTFTLIKPDCTPHAEEIVSIYEQHGLQVVQQKTLSLHEEKIRQFYAHLQDKPFFQEILDYMSQGPVVAIILEGDHAVEQVRALIGTTDPKKAPEGTIRHLFGQSIAKNGIHGSDSLESAAKEIAIVFGDS